jgi:uncharacterized membrane protein
MTKRARISVFIVVLLHFGFMALEMTQWNTEVGLALTHLSLSTANDTIGVGFNMGLYNGFLGMALLWSAFALSRREAYSVNGLILSFIVLAGIAGAISMKIPTIILSQSLPALIALILFQLDRPFPKTENEAIPEIAKMERLLLILKHADNPSASGLVSRGQHAKQHGCVQAKFVVASDMPEEMRFGVFKDPGKTFDAWVRFSNARKRDDREPGGHGMAIKLLNVCGEKLGNEPDSLTQDFVLFDAPVFFVGNPIQYAEFEEAVLRAYGKSELEEKATLILNYFWKHPRQLLNLRKAQRSAPTNPLEARYWSVTPYRLGDAPVKYSVQPELTNVKISADRSPDMLRESMKLHLSKQDAVFKFLIQSQADPKTMPVEDPTVEWDESRSRPIPVATIRISDQDFDTPEQRAFGENLSFTPWHTLPEHAPLGGINRTREAVYHSLSELRHALNHVPRKEPTEMRQID